jgi:hypothetical protein
MVLFSLLFGAALLYLGYLLLRWFRQANPAYIVRSLKMLMLGGLFFVLLSALLTGRVGIFIGGIALLTPFFPRLYRFFKGLPPKELGNSTGDGPSKDGEPEEPGSDGFGESEGSRRASEHENGSEGWGAPRQMQGSLHLTLEEARDILGVSEGATRKEIIDAHKRLICKIHPDQGGSNYLAMRVNQAKEKLL